LEQRAAAVASRWMSWFSLRCGTQRIIAADGVDIENKSFIESLIALPQKNILLSIVDRSLGGQRRRTVDDQHSTNCIVGTAHGGGNVLSADAVSVRRTGSD
jgi:hypothetical protein